MRLSGQRRIPAAAYHDVDLFYVVLEGSATLRLGHDNHQVEAGEVIYIPAGFPHGSDNQSGAAEHHLEILIPGVRQRIVTPGPGSGWSSTGRPPTAGTSTLSTRSTLQT
jgi:hypothetical protein